MALSKINADLDGRYIKSYATEAALERAIAKVSAKEGAEHNDRFLVVRTPSGRWTALVSLDMTKGGYLGRYSGFLKL